MGVDIKQKVKEVVMPKKISDINSLKKYISGVLDRAKHHAGNVDEIALAVVGAVVWRNDETDLKVLTRNGEMKNVLWVKIGEKLYVLSYNHDAQTIELREKTLRGHCIASFNNKTSLCEVKSIFEKL